MAAHRDSTYRRYFWAALPFAIAAWFIDGWLWFALSGAVFVLAVAGLVVMLRERRATR